MSDVNNEKEQVVTELKEATNKCQKPEEVLKDGNSETGSEDEEESLPEGYEGPYKMVYVVNTELGMGGGKIAAQVGHATLGLYRSMIDEENPESNIMDQLGYWEDFDGERKIALKGVNAQHLLDLEKQAKDKGLFSYLVHDAGHTQVAAGSITVLSMFGRDCLVNEITGKLKLL